MGILKKIIWAFCVVMGLIIVMLVLFGADIKIVSDLFFSPVGIILMFVTAALYALLFAAEDSIVKEKVKN